MKGSYLKRMFWRQVQWQKENGCREYGCVTQVIEEPVGRRYGLNGNNLWPGLERAAGEWWPNSAMPLRGSRRLSAFIGAFLYKVPFYMYPSSMTDRLTEQQLWLAKRRLVASIAGMFRGASRKRWHYDSSSRTLPNLQQRKRRFRRKRWRELDNTRLRHGKIPRASAPHNVNSFKGHIMAVAGNNQIQFLLVSPPFSRECKLRKIQRPLGNPQEKGQQSSGRITIKRKGWQQLPALINGLTLIPENRLKQFFNTLTTADV